MERTFDRVLREDDRSYYYATEIVAAARSTRRAEPPTTIYRRTLWLDQGKNSACTGYASAHCLSLAPQIHPGFTVSDAEAIYQGAKLHDELAGENYDGSSVLGAMAGLKAFGLIREYRWANSIPELKSALATIGPAVMGLNWYGSMMEPDSRGIITVDASSENRGGHAVCISGYQTTPTNGLYFKIDNSWGRSWGKDGSCWIAEAHMQFLLSRGGDIAVPTKPVPFDASKLYS